MKRVTVSRAIARERARQDAEWGAQTDIGHDRWFVIMMEELGEASAAHTDGDPDWCMSSRDELIQLAAILHRAIEVW